MSSSNDTIDTVLVTLASMGFDLDRGQAAIQAGKLTVHEAVEWLLQGGDQHSQELPTRSTPTLSLRPQQQSTGAPAQNQNYLPFSQPPILPADVPQSVAVPSDEQTPSGSTEDDDKVSSRFALTDKKREDKDRWEREQREELSAKYKEERMRKKKAHSKVLQEIEADRKAKQLKTPSQTSPSSAAPASTSDEGSPVPSSTTASSSSAPQRATSVASAAASPTTPSSSSSSSSSSPLSSLPPAAVGGTSEKAPASSPEKKDAIPIQPIVCTLQIRLPNGQQVREKFSSDATLDEVIIKMRRQGSSLGDHVELMQPFPRKVFSAEELARSLQDLGLTPSGTLVVRAGSPSQAQAPGIPQELNIGQPSPPTNRTGFRAGGRVELMPAPPMPNQPQPLAHRWGHGQAVGDRLEEGEEGGDQEMGAEEGAGVIEDAEMGEELPVNMEEPGNVGMDFDEAGFGMQHDMRDVEGDEEEDEEYEPQDWGVNVPPRHPHIPGMFGGGGQGGWPPGRGRGQHHWGEGRRLTGGAGGRFDYGFDPARRGEDEEEEEMESSPSPARIAAAALQRLGNVAAPGPSGSQLSPHAERPVASLLNLCVKCTCKRFEGPGGQGGSSRLEALPPALAERLLTELKKSGHLRPKTLIMFLPCHLQRLSLDCYKYTTNELLQSVRPHVNLTSLNLTSCPLITDQGLQNLTSLKKLQQLNLSNNKHLTDKVFQVVQEFPVLVTLILEGTAVTDRGIEVLVQTPPSNLSNLSLSRTGVTDTGVLYLARLPKLKYLGLEQTQVRTLEHIGHLSHLVSLNLARNRLTTDGLQHLHQVPTLRGLSIAHLEELVGDTALACLQGLQLVQLTLPDRHTTTDTGLKCIAGMALCALDLADYIHITDEGIHHLADMTSLQKLSISNTKVTSIGMAYLNGLTELRELHLDRTVVDDEGAKVIGQMTKLQVLSMAATKITDNFLLSGALNRCSQLSRLNLSRTDTTDNGIATLALPDLSLLNLDYTCVSATCAQNLTRCPNLKVTRINNLRNPRILDQN